MTKQFEQYLQFLPPDAIKIVLVLFLGFLIGIEREEHKAGAILILSAECARSRSSR